MSEQPRFILHSEGVVSEPARELMWTQHDAIDKGVTHAEAVAAVKKLNDDAFGGFADWCLPTVEELFLLADRTKYRPVIDTEFFPTCKNDWYWTSTDDASEEKDKDTGHSNYAWLVNFVDGGSGGGGRSGHGHVRAVRSSRQ